MKNLKATLKRVFLQVLFGKMFLKTLSVQIVVQVKKILNQLKTSSRELFIACIEQDRKARQLELCDEEIEAFAKEHEAFGFGLVDAKGYHSWV